MFVEPEQTPTWLTAFFGLSFAAAVVANLFLLRCPRCRGPVGTIQALLKQRFVSLARAMNFCPYCGVSLDELHTDGT